ncbi:MAG TPA: hemolysin III family protein [Cyclobacteriaceae bacterium]|jgi:hemolysin III|nr:hemolysin III family protein [Cyclobacteriaceae bacterium]HMV10542.1 hemolysin III family protein [Cyclobacteriaceae bacterium]HMV89604.1 hemolysin III family protein [Cyclobacteriaceae bacterium]HMW99446.1 hemolysin III family protein [Cyclobacteriaceae bacterium]HMX48765.1 hemolysin III family protein [Cyclobacteriaceae bacterium]
MSINVNSNSSREEIINWLTHAIGLLLSCAGLVILINKGSNDHLIAVCVYGGTLILLYLLSTLYHLIAHIKVKSIFRKLDHIGIFLLIAGTYTPFCLVAVNDNLGLTILAIVWLLALAGVIFKIFLTGKFEILSLLIYLSMGWMCIVVIKPVYDSLPFWSFILLMIGGLFYSSGVIFYRMSKLKYHHGVWHLFVIAGSASHFMSILAFV